MKRDPVVLVVEDDPYVSKLIALLLEESNYRVRTVDTAASALELVNAGDLDLVILDWMLPDTHGDQLCRMIKASSPNAFLPVLMLTARGEPADRVAGLDAGADDYLTKPFYANELLARVRALLRIRVSELDRISALDQLAQQHDTLKAAYDQLRSTQAQLVHASKLAALGELVAGVAHELNNPLAIILGNAELLPELEDEEDRRAVEQIINGAHRARRVVQSLVTFARAGKIEEEWYDPRLLVERVLDLRRTSLRAAGIILDVSYAPDLPMLWVDGPQIQQVLLNLLLNAEQALAGRPEQRIAICVFTSTEPVDHPPVLPESACTDEGQTDARIVVIDVADNGPGLSDQVADRVFQPFVTTKPVGQGTGLGLAISYGIVVQHGGSLEFSSEAGRGATFRVVLPADRPATQEVHDEPMILAEPVPKSVLLIDDEPDILDLAKRFLVRNKYSVATTQSARTALQMLRERAFDVILCDVRMPDMDGIAFYHELQATDLEHRPHMIVMTGDTSNAKTEEFLRMSKLPLLRKPFTSHELLEVVAFVELLERREV